MSDKTEGDKKTIESVSIEQYNELLKTVQELSKNIERYKDKEPKDEDKNDKKTYSDSKLAKEDEERKKKEEESLLNERVKATSFVRDFKDIADRDYPEVSEEVINEIVAYNTEHYKDIIEQKNMIKASLYKEYFNAVDSSYIPSVDKDFIESILHLKENELIKHLPKLEQIDKYTRDNKKNDARARISGSARGGKTGKAGSIEALQELINRVNKGNK